jgi:hypothetical protein
MTGLQKTTAAAPNNLQRVDFDQEKFTELIRQKGKDVILEVALMCGCKSPAANAQSNCRNCGGSGWIFVNAKETRMVLQKINLVNDFAPWSEENRGFVNITCNADEEIAFYDKLTDKNGIATFQQVLFFKEAEDHTIFTYTTYPIKAIKYVGLFKGVGVPHQKLVENVDYTFERNIITLINEDLIQGTIENTNITIRYKHSPVFHIVEMKRETMETYEFNAGSEVLKHMPLSAIARRAHYIPNIENISGNRLLNNDYTESTCNENIFMPKKVYPKIRQEFSESTSTYTNIKLIGKQIMLFRNGVLDSQYVLSLTTGMITPTFPYQASEYIDIYIWGNAS